MGCLLGFSELANEERKFLFTPHPGRGRSRPKAHLPLKSLASSSGHSDIETWLPTSRHSWEIVATDWPFQGWAVTLVEHLLDLGGRGRGNSPLYFQTHKSVTETPKLSLAPFGFYITLMTLEVQWPLSPFSSEPFSNPPP